MDTAQDQCSLSVGEPYGQEGDSASSEEGAA